jgi:hypothetical protein
MNTLEWFVQFLLAGIVFCAGTRRIFSLARNAATPQAEPLARGAGLPCKTLCAIALVEIAAALALALPIHPWRLDFVPVVAAACLALLALLIGIHHLRRHQSAGPALALFLLSLFVLVGHS